MVKGTKKPANLDKKSPTHTLPNLLKSPSLADKIELILILLIKVLIGLGQTPILILKAVFKLVRQSARLAILSVKKTSQVTLKTSREYLSFNTYLHKKAHQISKPKSAKIKTKPMPQNHWQAFWSMFDFMPKVSPLKLFLFTLLGSLIFYSFVLAKLTQDLPSPYYLTSVQRPLTTEIYDREGRILYQVYEGKDRKLIKLDELPPYLINATIAIEDKHFYTHPGVDMFGVLRALKINLEHDSMQGGSTITQQLIKNTLLTPDQNLSRKIKEAILALWTEVIYTKQEILTMYFNEVPYGGPAVGIEAASQMYFGKSVHDLDLAEAAYLAGLPAAPTEYSPFGTSPQKGKERQKEVLRRMVEDKYISQDVADHALAEQLTFKTPATDIKAAHFVMYIRSVLAQKYGERTVSQGGLKVTTTLDLDVQNMAEEVVSDQVDKLQELNVSNGAAMVTDAENGQILAMVGSKNYWDPNNGNFNVATALRQPGSSIKPVTYATAFEQGYTPGTVLLDVPTTFPNPWGQSYSPVNYDGRFHGPVTIRTALGSSYNIPAVKMLAIVGVPNMIKTAKEMGITTFDNNPQNYGLSLTLGGGEVTLVDMMSVYTTLASEGVRYTPNGILKVTDSYGHVLEDNTNPKGQRVLTDEVAYLITSILSDNNARTPAFGPNSLLKIDGKTIAVKTGTSDNKRDNWAFGYTPEYVVGAWVGNDDNTPMDPRLSSGITGATPIWHDIMYNLVKDRPDLAFKRPSGIIDKEVDGKKDLAISGAVPKTVVLAKKTRQVDDQGQEKDVITYTDPFTLNFNMDTLKNPVQN